MRPKQSCPMRTFAPCALQHMPQQTSQSPNPFLSSLGRKRGVFADIYGGNSNAVPADVALVSPQTPLIPPNHPLLSGGYSKPYPWIPFCFRAFSGFFASSLAIIRLNKLSTLSLRLFPPLKPFERRDYLADIYEGLGRTQGPTLLTSVRYTRRFGDTWGKRYTRGILEN